MTHNLIKSRKYFKAGNWGFTLIELLVVISIIGILAGMISANINSARAKARDVKRLSDINQIRTAMEMYYDQFSAYPTTTGGAWRCLSSPTCWKGGYSQQPTVTTALQPYMSKIPDDPKNLTSCYGDDYLYSSSVTPYSGAKTGAYLHWYFEQGPLSDKSCGSGFYGGAPAACAGGPIGYCWLYLGN